MTAQLYHEDCHAWALQNARLLREGRLDEIDALNIAEELEDLAGSKERELENRLGILLAQLLQGVFQPQRRGNVWRATVEEQRRRIARLLRKNPSLAAKLEECFVDAYGDARLIAARETGFDAKTFPEASPFTLEQTLNDAYWPD